MPVIQLEIDDMLVEKIGTKTVKDFMESQLSLLKLRYLGEKITEAIQKSGIEHKKELEEARKEAWLEYKDKHLKDIA